MTAASSVDITQFIAQGKPSRFLQRADRLDPGQGRTGSEARRPDDVQRRQARIRSVRRMLARMSGLEDVVHTIA
jgi:hypothetical protein